MAADVSSLARILSGYANRNNYRDDQAVSNESGEPTDLITRDLLGGTSFGKIDDSQELLDLDLQVPRGYEKLLDLKSGKFYIQRCNSSSTSSSDNKPPLNQTVSNLQDLNLPPSFSSSSSSRPTLCLFEETKLDLKLNHPISQSSNYQSVCTLDKVKSALERAETESSKKRSLLSKSSSVSDNSSSSIKVASQDLEDEVGEEKSSEYWQNGPLFAAGCPCCLLYVMIWKNNPKCPRCNAFVPLPVTKKPRIDLNMSI